MRVLVTGGTGFLGRALIRSLPCPDDCITVVARNEGKLTDLQNCHPCINIVCGDIADPHIAEKATRNIDKVYHLAAFKHVGLAEKDTFQCINTNIIGTMNLLEKAWVSSFVYISTDKAASVTGVYGASKFITERLVQEYQRMRPANRYTIVRYGNVLYSTGSILPKWKKALQAGEEIVITDPEATRFFWTVDEAIRTVFDAERMSQDANAWCPYIKSISMGNLLTAMQNKYGEATSIKKIGLQAGENLHEKMFTDGLDSSEVEQYTIEEIMEKI